jgi:hypothetical protein
VQRIVMMMRMMGFSFPERPGVFKTPGVRI